MPREHGVQVEDSCTLISLEMLLNVPTGHTTVEKQTRLRTVPTNSEKTDLSSGY